MKKLRHCHLAVCIHERECFWQSASAPEDKDDNDGDYSLKKTSVGSAVPSSAASATASTTSQEAADELRRSLLDAIGRDDVPGVDRLCKRIEALSLTLSELRDPTDRATCLHTALIQGRWNVATYLIRSTTDDRLLDEVFDVTGLYRHLISTSAASIPWGSSRPQQ